MSIDQPRSDSSEGGRSFRSLRILCADDDQLIAGMLQLALERMGHAVECVEDGQAAFRRLTSGAPPVDVLITDNRMPVLTGLGLVTELRNTTFSGYIVVHCSQLSPSEHQAFDSLGVHAILPKPCPLSELCGAIDGLAKSPPSS